MPKQRERPTQRKSRTAPGGHPAEHQIQQSPTGQKRHNDSIGGVTTGMLQLAMTTQPVGGPGLSLSPGRQQSGYSADTLNHHGTPKAWDDSKLSGMRLLVQACELRAPASEDEENVQTPGRKVAVNPSLGSPTRGRAPEGYYYDPSGNLREYTSYEAQCNAKRAEGNKRKYAEFGELLIAEFKKAHRDTLQQCSNWRDHQGDPLLGVRVKSLHFLDGQISCIDCKKSSNDYSSSAPARSAAEEDLLRRAEGTIAMLKKTNPELVAHKRKVVRKPTVANASRLRQTKRTTQKLAMGTSSRTQAS